MPRHRTAGHRVRASRGSRGWQGPHDRLCYPALRDYRGHDAAGLPPPELYECRAHPSPASSAFRSAHRAVRMAVDWGLAHRDLTNIEGHRRRRALAPPRATLPDAGLSDRRALQAPAVDRPRTQGRDVGGLLRLVRPRTQRGAVLRVLGHVEALPEGGCRARRAGGAGARPLPHHEPFLGGDRRGARGGGPEARRRRPGAGAQAQPLAPAQTSGESQRRAAGPACGAGASQPAHGSRLPAQGGLSSALGLRVAVLGRTVPRPLVHSDDALAARPDLVPPARRARGGGILRDRPEATAARSGSAARRKDVLFAPRKVPGVHPHR